VPVNPFKKRGFSAIFRENAFLYYEKPWHHQAFSRINITVLFDTGFCRLPNGKKMNRNEDGVKESAFSSIFS